MAAISGARATSSGGCGPDVSVPGHRLTTQHFRTWPCPGASMVLVRARSDPATLAVTSETSRPAGLGWSLAVPSAWAPGSPPHVPSPHRASLQPPRRAHLTPLPAGFLRGGSAVRQLCHRVCVLGQPQWGLSRWRKGLCVAAGLPGRVQWGPSLQLSMAIGAALTGHTQPFCPWLFCFPAQETRLSAHCGC